MGFQYWFTVCAAFLIVPISLVQSFFYCRRGVYTKTFKGTSRKEFIHVDEKPIEFWFSIISHMVMGMAMIILGFWLIEDIHVVNHWYADVRAMFLFDSPFLMAKTSLRRGFLSPGENHGHQSAWR